MIGEIYASQNLTVISRIDCEMIMQKVNLQLAMQVEKTLARWQSTLFFTGSAWSSLHYCLMTYWLLRDTSHLSSNRAEISNLSTSVVLLIPNCKGSMRPTWSIVKAIAELVWTVVPSTSEIHSSNAGTSFLSNECNNSREYIIQNGGSNMTDENSHLVYLDKNLHPLFSQGVFFQLTHLLQREY